MANIRSRKNAVKIATWDPTLLWYAKAVGEMQKRPLNDPTSWAYLAAIHGFPSGSPVDSNNPPPSSSERKKFWSQCQHHSWYFLPWHRAYLAMFEQIVMATIVKLGGPTDWALPYWNYSPNDSKARILPPAFRELKLPDGSANMLRITERSAGVNTGTRRLGDGQVDLRPCMNEIPFQASSSPGGDPGFGGPVTGFHHGSDGPNGQLESVPHNQVHGYVGGFMGSFDTAGLDPIFWLHHANIDRIWQIWLQRNNPKRRNPTSSDWLTKLTFKFHGADENEITFTPSQVVNTSAAPFFYEYDDLTDPVPSVTSLVAPEEAFGVDAMSDQVPEMVGANEEPVTLSGSAASTRMSVGEPTGPASFALAQGRSRVFLNIENITGEGSPENYYVYLNVPEGEKPENHPELYAGAISMFGVAEASIATAEHSGSGTHYSLEVTDVIAALKARGGWNPSNIRVTFVPTDAEAQSNPHNFRVGRVSLYYST